VPNAYFQRLDASGAPAGGEVALTSFTSATGGLVNSAEITWTGTEWGVIWSQSIYLAPPAQERLVLQRIAQDGSMIGAPAAADAVDEWGLLLAARSLVLLHTATAGFAVMYTGSRGPAYYETRLFRVLGDGTAPSAPVQIAEHAPTGDAVVGPGDTFGVVFVDGLSGMAFRRVEPDGALVSPPVTVFARSGSAFANATLLYDGSQYIFAWREEDFVGSTNYDHRISIARGTGAAAPSEAAVVRTARRVIDDTHPVRHPRLALRDGTVLLTWQQVTTGGTSFRIDAQRYAVATDAMVALEPVSTVQPLAVTDHQIHDLVWTSATTAVLGWADTRWGDTEIYDLGLTLPACGP